MNFEKLSKKAIGRMYTSILLRCILLCALYLWGLHLIQTDVLPFREFPWKIVITVCWIVLLAEGLVSPLFRYQRYRYSITEEEVQVKTGYIFLTHTIVPISRLHKINIEAGPLNRMFGLSNVEITTAGGDITIEFLEKEQAEQLAKRLKTRINTIVEQEKTHGNQIS